MSAPSVYPTLGYIDAKAEIDWLTSAFGFTATLVVPGEGDAIVHAELRTGNGMVMLSTLREDPAGPARRASQEFRVADHGVYVVVGDVDAHHARAVAAGAEIVMPPTDQEYGSRDYAAQDPEGHLWSFGTYQPEEG